eukprot:7430640-Alexandrium_andersonii.AAC.1
MEDDGDVGHVGGEDAGLVGVVALARAEPEGFLLRVLLVPAPLLDEELLVVAPPRPPHHRATAR